MVETAPGVQVPVAVLVVYEGVSVPVPVLIVEDDGSALIGFCGELSACVAVAASAAVRDVGVAGVSTGSGPFTATARRLTAPSPGTGATTR